MKSLSSLSSLLASLLAVGFVGCSHAQAVAPPAPTAQPTLAARPPAAPQASQKAAGQADLDRALDQLRAVSVFFKFDDSTVSAEAEKPLADIGLILAKYPALKLEISGNADERGSEQYNLALGQRRAESAKRYLVQMGARPEQLATVSFGDQKPKATGHDEAAWEQNRRDDLRPK